MQRHFVKSSLIAAPVERVFAFHQRSDALEQLTPPWERATVVQPPRSLAVGTRVIVRSHIGPLPVTIEAEHIEYDPPHGFTDRMVRGPFAAWVHHHRFLREGDSTRLVDEITYELPLGALGALFGERMVRRRLERMFAYRHEVTRRACEG